MAYQMEYAYDHLKKTRFIDKKYNSFIVGLFLVALVILIRLASVAADIVLFSDAKQLQVSATQMVDQLRNGTDLDDAVYSFCEELSYAKSYD